MTKAQSLLFVVVLIIVITSYIIIRSQLEIKQSLSISRMNLWFTRATNIDKDSNYTSITSSLTNLTLPASTTSIPLSISLAPTISGTSTTTVPTKLILTWTKFYGKNMSDILSKRLSIRECPFSCRYTTDKSMVSSADALIFHISDMQLLHLPSIRHSYQRYIFFLRESPYHSGTYETLPADFFNLTMTYRRDSDIITPIDAFFKIESNDSTNSYYSWHEVQQAVARKTRIALQFVSNCNTKSGREQYVRKLINEQLEVDVFGACTKMGIRCKRLSECEYKILDKYRFYLAFENSVCRYL